MSAPDVSVVVPTWNRVGTVSRMLDDLREQSLAPDRFEVIVVDDGSTDDTVERLRATAWPFPLRVIEQDHRGQAAALNLGAELAESETVLFLDDDMRSDPALLEEHVAARREHPDAVVLGHMDFELEPDAGTLATRLALWWPVHYERLADDRTPVTFMAAFSGNLSLPAELFRRVGGFATELPRSYDVELGYRLHLAGASFIYAPTARSSQLFDKDDRAVLRDAEREGAAAPHLIERHPALFRHLRAGQLHELGTAVRLLILAFARLPRAAADHRLLRLCPARLRAQLAGVLYDAMYWRGLRGGASAELWDSLVRPPLVLMYHAFDPPGAKGSRWVIPGPRFEGHLEAIRRSGRRVVSLEEVVSAVEQDRPAPGNTVVLTIDDGYADVASVASPPLRRRRHPATVYLVTGGMGGRNTWDDSPALRGRALLSWEQAEAMSHDDISFGGHTRSHPRLDLVDDETALRETEGCFDDLRAHLADTATSFAYPYGKRQEAVASTIGKTFTNAVGIRPGPVLPTSHLDELPRNEVFGTWSGRRLEIGLRLGVIDWPTRLRWAVGGAARRTLKVPRRRG